MLRIGRLAVALSVLSAVASAQEDPLAWFPLQVGSRWVYEYESKSGDRNRPDVDRWTTEETITGRLSIPEGLVVLRELKQLPNPSDQITTVRAIAPNGQLRYVQQPDYNRRVLTARDREPYLVHGNCIYVVGGSWDGQRQRLRPEYLKYLTDGAVSPDFCFPIANRPRVGKRRCSVARRAGPRGRSLVLASGVWERHSHFFEPFRQRRMERCLVSKRRRRSG